MMMLKQLRGTGFVFTIMAEWNGYHCGNARHSASESWKEITGPENLDPCHISNARDASFLHSTEEPRSGPDVSQDLAVLIGRKYIRCGVAM